MLSEQQFQFVLPMCLLGVFLCLFVLDMRKWIHIYNRDRRRLIAISALLVACVVMASPFVVVYLEVQGLAAQYTVAIAGSVVMLALLLPAVFLIVFIGKIFRALGHDRSFERWVTPEHMLSDYPGRPYRNYLENNFAARADMPGSDRTVMGNNNFSAVNGSCSNGNSNLVEEIREALQSNPKRRKTDQQTELTDGDFSSVSDGIAAIDIKLSELNGKLALCQSAQVEGANEPYALDLDAHAAGVRTNADLSEISSERQLWTSARELVCQQQRELDVLRKHFISAERHRCELESRVQKLITESAKYKRLATQAMEQARRAISKQQQTLDAYRGERDARMKMLDRTKKAVMSASSPT